MSPHITNICDTDVGLHVNGFVPGLFSPLVCVKKLMPIYDYWIYLFAF